MSNQKKFSSITIALLVVGLVIGVGGGYFVSSSSLLPKIDGLENQVSSLNSEINALEEEKSDLGDKIDVIQSRLTALDAKFTTDLGRLDEIIDGVISLWTDDNGYIYPNNVGTSFLITDTGNLYIPGNVGIETSSPEQPLSVWNGMNIDQSNLNDGTIAGGLRFGHGWSGEGIASKRTGGSPNQWGIDFYTANTNRMAITNDGKVGIGTTNPDDGKLEVNGEISTGDGGLRWKLFSGTTGASSIYFSHGLDASKIFSVSCVLRNAFDGVGYCQEHGVPMIAEDFKVSFDDTYVRIQGIGSYLWAADDTFRCIVWYTD